MKPLFRLATGRPIGVTILFLAVIMFGLVSLRQLSVDLFPSIEVPQLTITTRYAGVAPVEIETLLTRPIEQATATIEGVERIEATSSEGLSRVRLQFAWGTDLDQALDEVRVAVDRVRARLPEESEPPSIFKFDLASVPIVQLGVTGETEPRKLKHFAEEELSQALERVPGVASVDVQGGQDREVRVALSPERLEALGLSAVQVGQALRRENMTVAGGAMRDRGREVSVRTAGEFESVGAIGDIVVATQDGQPVRVSDLGSVEDTVREIRSELYIDGDPGIRLRIYKQSGANTVDVVDELRRTMDRQNLQNGEQAQMTMLWDGSSFIRAAVSNIEISAALGAALAALVLLAFLRSLRTTIVVAVAIPISVISSFSLMYLEGMTLNIISFGGIALGVGMLVDGAIVIVESIHHHRQLGLSPRQAAIEGASEVGGAVVAGTVTTIAVFVPVVFVGDLAGVLFKEMALVVTFALICSLAVALTLIPMLYARFLGSPSARTDRAHAGNTPGLMARVQTHYGRLLSTLMAAPFAILTGAAILLAASVALAMQIDTEILPESDEGMLDIDLEMVEGTPLKTTSAITRDVEHKATALLRQGELAHVVTSVGPEAWWRPGGSHQGEVELTLVPVTDRTRSVVEVQAILEKELANVPGAKMRIRPRSSNILNRIIRRGEDRLSVEIRGHDLDTVSSLSDEVVAIMEKVPGITYARPDRELGQLERRLIVDRARAAELGLGSADIAETVEHYVLGSVATRFREGGDEYDVRVQLGESDREQLALLPSLPVVTPSGQSVPLGALVTIEGGRSPSSIARVNQQRVLRIDAGTEGRSLSDVAADLDRQLREVPVPEGFSVDLSGELAEQEETTNSFLVGLLLAAFLVFATMAVQFESLRQPLLVMASVPFALTGAVAVLMLTGTTFSMNVFLGAIVLVGIVVNNAIVLVDATNKARESGLELIAAIEFAAMRRLRPILMTTATTMLGLIPLAFGGTEGGELQAPLARTVVGGLASSTLVTLVLVPCLYLLVERKRAVVAEAPAMVEST